MYSITATIAAAKVAKVDRLTAAVAYSAAVADIAHPNWRGSAIGIYRFWRDLGYGIGALGLGLVARASADIASGFVFVALSMLLSGLLLWWIGEETHPRLNPA